MSHIFKTLTWIYLILKGGYCDFFIHNPFGIFKLLDVQAVNNIFNFWMLGLRACNFFVSFKPCYDRIPCSLSSEIYVSYFVMRYDLPTSTQPRPDPELSGALGQKK